MSNCTKNILFLLNSIACGGAERQSIDLINNFDRNLFGVGLAYLNPKEDLLFQVDRSKLLCLECLERSGKFDFSVLNRLRNLIVHHEIDTVFCATEYALLYAFLCRKRFAHNFKLAVAIHRPIFKSGIWEFIRNELYRRLLNYSDVVVFVCKKQLNYWVEKFSIQRSRSTYIYNGIDVSRFTDKLSPKEKGELREKLGFSTTDFVAGICAVLRPEKKHKDFIDAIIAARKKGAPVKGLIIGDGPERQFIEGYLSEHALKDDIVLAGFQSDVRPFIGICDCMVLASLVEIFSIAVLECMAMCKPVIMTNVGGASEQITHGKNGFLFEKGDTASLASSFIKLMEDGLCKRMGEEALKTVRANFSLQTMVASYEKLLGCG